MIVWFSAIALVIVLIYYLTQRRHSDEVWRRFRMRRIERQRHPPADQPIDPTFQFDQPASQAEEKDKPSEPG